MKQIASYFVDSAYFPAITRSFITYWKKPTCKKEHSHVKTLWKVLSANIALDVSMVGAISIPAMFGSQNGEPNLNVFLTRCIEPTEWEIKKFCTAAAHFPDILSVIHWSQTVVSLCFMWRIFDDGKSELFQFWNALNSHIPPHWCIWSHWLRKYEQRIRIYRRLGLLATGHIHHIAFTKSKYYWLCILVWQAELQSGDLANYRI